MSDETGIKNNAEANNYGTDIPAFVLILVAIAAIAALIVSIVALATIRGTLEDVRDALRGSVAASSEAALASERADKAERSAALSREYAVSAFFQTQVEWSKHGVIIQSPLEHHDPIPDEAYTQHDNYVETQE